MPVEVHDFTNRPDTEANKVWIIRDSGTYLGLLSFDYALDAFAAAKLYNQPLEIHWAQAILAQA